MARNQNKERQDKRGENIVHNFLEREFYPRTTNYRYACDKATQLQGIDTVFSYNGIEYRCDEKASVDYVNKNLQTFCLELSCLDRNNRLMDGWFVNENNTNNSYMFVWVDKAVSNRINSIEDFTEVEYMLVLKQDIIDYLSSIGWAHESLQNKAERIRFCEDRNFGVISINGCKFTFSERLPEKPINVLLSRDIYRNMPHTACFKYIE